MVVSVIVSHYLGILPIIHDNILVSARADTPPNCEGLHRIYDKTKSDIFHFSDARVVNRQHQKLAKLSVFHDFENICCLVQGCACLNASVQQ